jgi:hypothetical protein
MKKLALKLDDLRIDSFETTSRTSGKGTVFGEQCTCWTNCTCPGCPTCDATCGGNTCDGTCDCGGETNLCTFDGANTCQGSCAGGDTCDYTCWGFVTVGPGGDCREC